MSARSRVSPWFRRTDAEKHDADLFLHELRHGDTGNVRSSGSALADELDWLLNGAPVIQLRQNPWAGTKRPTDFVDDLIESLKMLKDPPP